MVAPERRMSSWVITKIAAPVFASFCSFFETGDHLDVHQVFQAELSEVARRRSLGPATDWYSQTESEGNAHAHQGNCNATPRPAFGQRFRHKALIGSLAYTTNLMLAAHLPLGLLRQGVYMRLVPLKKLNLCDGRFHHLR